MQCTSLCPSLSLDRVLGIQRLDFYSPASGESSVAWSVHQPSQYHHFKHLSDRSKYVSKFPSNLLVELSVY